LKRCPHPFLERVEMKGLGIFGGTTRFKSSTSETPEPGKDVSNPLLS
jgi:hypothetical protein